MEILVITGMSGAGKSTALHALEDLGTYCIDNLPVALLPQLVAELDGVENRETVAIGIDARDAKHLERFPSIRDHLMKAGHQVKVLFFDAPAHTLVRRFSETRRRHPMGELPEAIAQENLHLAGLRELASWTIDTETLSAKDLRTLIADRFGREVALTVVLLSFGYKFGLPREADLVFDARFLRNPYDVPELRPLSGLDCEVSNFVLEQPDSRQMLEMAESWVKFQLPRSLSEGRTTLTIAWGCTGGQHRSVTMCEALHRRLINAEKRFPAKFKVRHRDVHPSSPAPSSQRP